MTTLMVTPYPPYRDGIGTYAVQEVRRLRGAGTEVEVLSPLPSAAHHHLALGNLRGALALIKRARRYESTMIQFSPEMFFGACRGPLERVAVWGALAALARATTLEIRLHEIEFGPLSRNPAERFAAARALRAASVVSVHTQPEVDRLSEALGLAPSAVTLVEHGQHFVQAAVETRAEARAELGLDPDRHLFLAIGFLQEHKGFDRAAEAFRAAGLGSVAELHIVGSVRVNHPDLVAYARSLRRLCGTISGVELHERYVSDADFDRWILAADTVVLPYREIWSSSVLERAKLLDRPIVAAEVGGLGDQAPEGTLFFDDAESLAQCLKERAATSDTARDPADGDAGIEGGIAPAAAAASKALRGGDGRARSGQDWLVDPARPDRVAIEAQLRRRARSDRSEGGTGRPVRAANATANATAGVTGRFTAKADADPLDPLVSLHPIQRPEPVSARPGVGRMKRTLRRLMDWELAPIVLGIDELRRATTEAVERLDARTGRAGEVPIDPTGRRFVEEPFVHGALADVDPGASVLLVGGAGSALAAALEATGYRLTVIPEASAGSDATVAMSGGGFDAVIVLSEVMHGLGSRYGPLLAPEGRLVVSLAYGVGGVVTSRSAIADQLAGLRLGFARTAVLDPSSGAWRVEADGLPEASSPDSEQRLVLLVAAPG